MRLFDYDSGFSALFRRVTGCVLLGFLWLAGFLLVVPAGAASAAIYYTVEKHIIREEGNLFSCFWDSFRENFRTATLLWIIFLGVGLFLGWDFYFFFQLLRIGNAEGILCVVIGILFVLLLLLAVYAFSYTARFHDTTGRVLKNSLLLMLSHPLVNLKIALLGLLLLLTALAKPAVVLLLPGFFCWMICLSMEKIFTRIKLRDE